MLSQGVGVLDGRYALDAVLGRGGMADVYRATDSVLEREVAVKVLRSHTTDDADRARFREEAQMLAALDHPNLVTVLDAGVSDDVAYLVMDLIDGKSLAPFCRGRGIAGHRVARIGADLAGVLGYVHARGIVHRDVKPGNVLLGTAGRVKLADFGIARLIGDTVRHTRTGQAIGTAAYLAPEQVRGEPVTAASDVYSLGLVLLEALTGRRAYTGGPMEAALARLDHAPLIPSSLPTGWPALLTQMTAFAPDARPTMAEIEPVLRALEVASTPSSGRRVTDQVG
jgi:serine/threonine protein kinase